MTVIHLLMLYLQVFQQSLSVLCQKLEKSDNKAKQRYKVEIYKDNIKIKIKIT